MNGVNSWTRKSSHFGGGRNSGSGRKTAQGAQSPAMTWTGNAAGIREDFYARAAESALHAFHSAQTLTGGSQQDVASRLEKFHQYIRSEQYERDLDQFAQSNEIRYERFTPLRYPYHHPQLEIRIAAKSWIIWESFRDKLQSGNPQGSPKIVLTLAVAFTGNKLGQMSHFAYSAFSGDSRSERSTPSSASPKPSTASPARPTAPRAAASPRKRKPAPVVSRKTKPAVSAVKRKKRAA